MTGAWLLAGAVIFFGLAIATTWVLGVGRPRWECADYGKAVGASRTYIHRDAGCMVVMPDGSVRHRP